MNRKLIALAVVFLLTTLAGGQGKKPTKKADERPKATAAATEELKETLKKLETDRADMTVRGDADALAKNTSDDYVLIDANGNVSGKAEMLEGFKSGASKMESNQPSDMTVRVYGNTAVVTGTSKVKGKIRGRAINGTMRFTRVWVKKAGDWQTVSLQQTPVTPGAK